MNLNALARPALLLAAVGLAGCGMFQPVPLNLDYAQTRASEQGLYRLSYASEVQPPPISRLHSWTLHLETPDGKPIDGATLKVDGDMPQHGHGLPTRPVVTRTLGHGDYMVEGMKFQMGGWWQVYVDVSAGDRHDKVTFNLQLE
jgi:hypothetical protein